MKSCQGKSEGSNKSNPAVDKKRVGDCKRCGSCCMFLYKCPFLKFENHGSNKSICTIHGLRPPSAGNIQGRNGKKA